MSGLPCGAMLASDARQEPAEACRFFSLVTPFLFYFSGFFWGTPTCVHLYITKELISEKTCILTSQQACEWQAEVQSLSQELGRANAAAEEWKSRATSQEAFIRAFEGSKAPSLASDSSSNSDAESPRSSGTAASCQNDAESDASSRSMIKLEMDIARLQSRVAGLQTEGKWKHKRILQLEEELSKLMIELENSEVQQAKLEAELEIAKEPATSSWLAASRQFLMDGIESDSAKSSPRMLGRSITGLQKLCHVAQEDVDDGEELTWLSESVEGSATPRSYVGKKKGDSCSSASASDVGSPMEEDCSATATLEDFIWGGNEPLTP
eukprot:CAMPEP_0117648710 /NCGR_PEP_ID=MMETSP0804-20121206/562_1 /TAXON_ID=1074897 /ORGANISM="Tetraselmis astigmatica, Strain CCMP880" /LENGTH=323 /DNA_ID=CAMNT_0005454355 /DNA_START=318 /DNA_END=1290 /DNA_ORIENTATION=-